MQGLCVALLCLLGAVWAGVPMGDPEPPSFPARFVHHFLERLEDAQPGAVERHCIHELQEAGLLQVGPPPPLPEEPDTKREQMATLLRRYLSSRDKRAVDLPEPEELLLRICKRIIQPRPPQ